MTATESSQTTGRRVLGITCAAHALIHVFELSVPPLLLLIQAEFIVGDLAMGRVVALYGTLFGLGALPAGWLVDRVGAKRLLLVCIWGAAACCLGMALSPSLWLFSVSAACMGLCLSIYHPAGTALISQALPNSGRVFAFHGMAGNSGVAIAGGLTGLLGQQFGWRVALGLLAAIGLVVGTLIVGLKADRPVHLSAARARGSWLPFLLLLLAAGLMGMIYRGFTTFLPKFFSQSVSSGEGGLTAFANSPIAGGGLLTTATLIVGIVGMFISGRLIDRGWGPATVFAIGAVAQVPFLWGLAHLSGGGLVPLAMGVALFHFMTQPAGNQLVAKLTPPSLRGLGYGIYFFLVFGVGAAGALYSGWVSQTMGIERVFPMLAWLVLPTLILLLVLGARLAVAQGHDPTRANALPHLSGDFEPGPARSIQARSIQVLRRARS